MLQEIIDVLAQYTDVPSEQINETSNLIDDLDLNSFDVMTIVADFEEQYDFHIPDEQIMEFKTVADIEEYLEKNRPARVVEMDTVEGIKGETLLLTLLWRQANFMVAYKIENKEADTVNNFFKNLNLPFSPSKI